MPDSNPDPAPLCHRAQRPASWVGEKPHLLSRGTSVRLHPPTERKTAQCKLRLLLQAQPWVCPDLPGKAGEALFQGDGSLRTTGGTPGGERTLCLPPKELSPTWRGGADSGGGTQQSEWKQACESLGGAPNLWRGKLRKMPSIVTQSPPHSGRSSS